MRHSTCCTVFSFSAFRCGTDIYRLFWKQSLSHNHLHWYSQRKLAAKIKKNQTN